MQEPNAPGASSSAKTTLHGYEFAFPAVGTLVHLKAFHRDKATVQRAFELAQRRVHELEAILTDYDPRSETRKLAELPVGQSMRVSEDLWDVLLSSNEWYSKTDGAFDASMGVLTRLWRKYRRIDRLPSEAEISQALDRIGWNHVQLDPSDHSVRFLKEGIQLDFGAIGKGYIVDEAFEVLSENELRICLVNIGGNMRAGDAPPGKTGWKIEVAPLEKEGKPLRQLFLVNRAIATSGDLWQFSLIDGKRRSHILDPKTGFGVAGPMSATVVANHATDADAMATAACILEFSRAAVIARQSGGMELLVVDRISSDAPSIRTSPGFPSDSES